VNHSALIFSIATGLAINAIAGTSTTTSSNTTPATLTVGTCLSATSPYTTISAAVTAAAAGATVNVCPGFYPEQVTISKSLSLVGLLVGSSDNPVIQVPAGGVVVNATRLRDGLPAAAQIFVSKGATVNITNITVDGSNSGIKGCTPDLMGILYEFASGTINRVVARNQALTTDLNGCQSGEGIVVETISTMSGSAAVSITNSSVHGYQKSGIVADGSNTKVTAQFNFVTGQGPTTGAAANGIEFISGACGAITGNVILNNIYIPGNTFTAATGILIYGAQGVAISANSIGDSQIPIGLYSDSTLPNPGNPNGVSDKTIVLANVISNTPFDGIDACSNSNTITANLIVNAQTSGVHLDSTCSTAGTGKSNTVSGNSINESCAGVLLGSTPNTLSSNVTFNVQNVTLAGDTCTLATKKTLLTVAGTASHPVPVPF
jgi:hypothetical protein